MGKCFSLGLFEACRKRLGHASAIPWEEVSDDLFSYCSAVRAARNERYQEEREKYGEKFAYLTHIPVLPQVSLMTGGDATSSVSHTTCTNNTWFGVEWLENGETSFFYGRKEGEGVGDVVVKSLMTSIPSATGSTRVMTSAGQLYLIREYGMSKEELESNGVPVAQVVDEALQALQSGVVGQYDHVVLKMPGSRYQLARIYAEEDVPLKILTNEETTNFLRDISNNNSWIPDEVVSHLPA
jgi:hypothetical protein